MGLTWPAGYATLQRDLGWEELKNVSTRAGRTLQAGRELRSILGNTYEVVALLTMGTVLPDFEGAQRLARELLPTIDRGIKSYDDAQKAFPKIIRPDHLKAQNSVVWGSEGSDDDNSGRPDRSTAIGGSPGRGRESDWPSGPHDHANPGNTAD